MLARTPPPNRTCVQGCGTSNPHGQRCHTTTARLETRMSLANDKSGKPMLVAAMLARRIATHRMQTRCVFTLGCFGEAPWRKGDEVTMAHRPDSVRGGLL